MSTDGPSRPGAGHPARLVLALPAGPRRDRIRRLLEGHGLEVQPAAPPGGDIVTYVCAQDADLVVVDRGDLDPRDERRLDDLADREDVPGVLVLDRQPDAARRADLVTAGAADVLDVEDLDEYTASAIESLAASEGHPRPDEAAGRPPSLADFGSRSPRMVRFMELVERVADTDSSLLVTGETGVGKEHLARAIHAASQRRDRPFVAVNCGALPESLLESELFGHEKGAFTGAISARRGVFEQAEGGTLMLDEIAEMPVHLQVKLLAALQRGEVRPLGSEEDRRVDVRIIAATNRDLAEDIQAGRFREDLYYRLNVVLLEVPPLRERRSDLPTLIGGLLRHLRDRTGRHDVEGLEPDALEAIMEHDWPGNVRELLNVLERALLVGTTPRIRREDLPRSLGGSGGGAHASSTLLPQGWASHPWREMRDEVLARFERMYLDALLREHTGRVGETASHAGLSPRSLYDKMKRHGLRKESYRPP